MDIMGPSLEQQVSPPPWLSARTELDTPALIREAMTKHPKANVDEIARQLAAWGVQASGIIISMWLPHWSKRTEQAKHGGEPAQVAGNAEEADLYCTCDDEPCSCEKRASPWWRQYCCGVRITPAQAKARDELFERAAT